MLVRCCSSFQTTRAYWNSIAEVFAIARKQPHLFDGYVRACNTERARVYIIMYKYIRIRARITGRASRTYVCTYALRVSRCDVNT